MGLSLSSFITNFFIWAANVLMTWTQEDLKGALSVSIFSSEVWQYEQMKTYLGIGVPNAMSNMLEFLGFDLASFIAAILGVNEEATVIVVMNFLAM